MPKIIPPTQEQIHKLLVEYGYFKNQGIVGYAVGVASPEFGGQLFFDGALVDYRNVTMAFDEARFDLASISKVFTAALLTRCALRDPELWKRSVTSCVPRGFPPLPPAFDPITLLNLANYTSGLPADYSDTSIDVPTPLPEPFTAPSMYGYLNGGSVAVSGTGTTFTYSNLAPALLAEAIPVAIGSKLRFAELLASEITDPLGMSRTAPFAEVSFSEMPQPMNGGQPVPFGWNELPAFTGGSGLVTTPNDMMRWLQFQMGMLDTPLNAILPRMQTPTNDIVSFEGRLCVGWFLGNITAKNHGEPISLPILYKAGELIGSSSFICFLPSVQPGFLPSQLGMFLLTNNTISQAGGLFGFQLILALCGYPDATDINFQP